MMNWVESTKSYFSATGTKKPVVLFKNTYTGTNIPDHIVETNQWYRVDLKPF